MSIGTGKKPAFSLRRLAPLAALAALTAVAIWQDWHRYISLEWIAANRQALTEFVANGFLGALMVYMGLYVAVVALSLPGGVFLTITGGFLFGWMVGAMATVVGATLGATIIFVIARTALGEPLARRAGPRLAKLRQGFQDDAFNYLLFLRLVPAFPFWLVNLAPALLGVSPHVYIVATFIGIIPGTLAFSFLGAGLDSIIARQQAVYDACIARQQAEGDILPGIVCDFELSPASLLTGELLLAFAALGVVALIPVGVRKWRNRPAAGA